MMKDRIIVCPLIHWDREWIVDEAIAGERLVDLFARLKSYYLSNPDYPPIFLDGQSGIIEDYLEHCYDGDNVILDLIKENKLRIGTWYYPPDLNLPAGESIIRNLLLGSRFLEKLELRSRIAYLPDAFGHFRQIPQILKQLDIDFYYFWRGLGEIGEQLGQAFIWAAPDESEVVAFRFMPNFFNARHIGYDSSGKLDLELVHQQVSALIDLQEPYDNVQIHLLAFRDPTPDLPKIVDEIQKSFGATMTIEFADLEQMLNNSVGVRRFTKYCGELREERYCNIFRGTYSSRTWVKRSNANIETRVLDLTEPLCVFAEWLGYEYPQGSLRKIWKTLIKNQFHDTICGTGVDDVYRDVESRFKSLFDATEYMIESRLKWICEKSGLAEDDIGIIVYNPHPFTVTRDIEANVCVPLEWRKNEGVELVDAAGAVIPVCILEERIKSENDDLRMPPNAYLHISFRPGTLPPFGLVFYRLRPSHIYYKNESCLTNMFISGNWRISLDNDGTIELEDIFQHSKIHKLGYFIDEADSGDLYNFNPRGHKYLSSLNIPVTNQNVFESGEYYSIISHRNWPIPTGLDENSSERADDYANLEITNNIRISKHGPRIDFFIQIKNLSRDHRLSFVVPTGICSGSIYALRQFSLDEHLIRDPRIQGQSESTSLDDIANGVLLIKDTQNRSVSIFTQGSFEYSTLVEENGEIAIRLTLLRSVGWLSKPGIKARKEPAGPCVPTPQAQMIGDHEFRISLYLEESDITHIMKEAQSFICPPIAVQPNLLMLLRKLENPWRILPRNLSKMIKNDKDPTPSKKISFLSLGGEGVIFTCLKKADDQDGYILRGYNITDTNTTVALKVKYAVNAWLCNLREETINYLGQGTCFSFEIKKNSIFTIRIRPLS